MAVKFMLFRKKNPKTQTLQWYATPKSDFSTGIGSISSESLHGSTISDIETETTLRQVGQYIPRELIKGNTVKVPGLGTFCVSFHSNGVDDINSFDAKKMINGIHVIFLPEKALKNALATQLNLVNVGIKDGNVIYSSVADYLRNRDLGLSENESGGCSDQVDSDGSLE